LRSSPNVESAEQFAVVAEISRDQSSSLVPSANVSQNQPSLRRHQLLVVTLLFAGYAAYYFCRADFSVAMLLLIEELGRHGVRSGEAIVRLGSIASFGVLSYALGKLFLTGIGDFWGGKRSFTVGLSGAIVFTLLFASSGALPVFTIAWIGNRLVQSIGWAGLIKVCSRWFGYSSYGTILGIISLSFLVGDAVARRWMGSLIEQGYGWRALFVFAAGISTIVLFANLLFLRDSRMEFGFAEPQVNPFNVYRAGSSGAGSKSKSKALWLLLRPLLQNRAFLVVCVLSFGCTVVRETFNTWTPTFLHDSVGYTASRAASLSAIFPAVGAVSVVLTGWISDQLGPYGRSSVMFFGLAATAVALLMLALPSGSTQSPGALILIGVIAFGLLGPYSYLAGAFALDFGGSQGAAASSGLIDGVGYLGGVLAGDSVARLSVASGWRSVFVALSMVSALSAIGAAWLLVLQREQVRKSRLDAQSV
jgi:sugar phosphate permease